MKGRGLMKLMLIPVMNKGIAANQASNDLMKQVRQKCTCASFNRKAIFLSSEMKMSQTSVFIV